MPTLELVIDATGMQRGAQQAEQALKGVATTAERTAVSVQSTGRALSNTFQVTQGGVQIATGIAQTAQAFQSLNLAASGFVGARTLLEIGQTVTQLAALRSGAAAASGAMLLLGRAIPYVGLALSAATAAYAIFGGGVSATTSKINEQVDALGRLQSKIGEITIRAGYGQADPRKTVGGTIDTLTSLRLSDKYQFSASDAAGLFGVTEQEMRYALARSGLGEEALELRPWTPFERERGFDSGAYRQPFRMDTFGQDQVVRAGEDILRDRRGVPESPYWANAGTGPEALSMNRSWHEAQQANDEAIARQQEESARRTAESMAQAAAYAASIGASLGAGVFDVLAGIQSWRQALSQIVASFAKQGLSDLGASFFANAFKPTSTQQTGG